MPLNFSAAPSSRITKSRRKAPSLQRSSSLPFAGHLRRKPISRAHSKPDTGENDGSCLEDRLHNVSLVTSLGPEFSVLQAIQHTHTHMFEDIPESGGFNSTRVAGVLNFRKSLPPFVTVAHVHALIDSPTIAERAISQLVTAAVVRKITVPGRGTGGSSIGDGLVLVEDLERTIDGSPSLSPELREKFARFLLKQPATSAVPHGEFATHEETLLMRAGFLTSSQTTASANIFNRPHVAAPGTVTSVTRISKAASGTVAAVGGQGAVHQAGTGGGGLRRSSSQYEPQQHQEFSSSPSSGTGPFNVTLPNTGPYLKLLMSARTHVLSLLAKSRYREAPVQLLRERWDGGVLGDDPASKVKKYRGEFLGVLPARTRKWKDFYGLRFDWVLAECLGAGLVEVFETGSVSRGVRAI